MTFKQFLFTMICATLLVWLGWFFILLYLDPTTANWLDLVFFYLTLATAIVGTLTIFGTVVRRWFKPTDLVSRHVSVSFRQAVWLALLITSSLFFLSHEIFRLWIIFLLVIIFSLFELAFLTSRRRLNISS